MTKAQEMLDLAREIEDESDGLLMMKPIGPVQLGIRKSAAVVAALRLAAQSDAPDGQPQSPPDAWRWRYEGCKGWMYTDNEPAFFPDEERLKPEVQRLSASAHSRPDREGK